MKVVMLKGDMHSGFPQNQKSSGDAIEDTLCEHVMSVSTPPRSPVPALPPPLAEVDTFKRALKADTKDGLQEKQASVIADGGDMAMEFDKIAGLVGREFAGSKNETLSSSFEAVSSLASESTWSLKLIQQEKSCWHSLEKGLNFGERKPILSESGDSSFNSSSSDDSSVDFGLIQGNRSSHGCGAQRQENGSIFAGNFERLPKEAKEEVVKFLKGFLPAPFEWTSDTEESSDSEISSVFEEQCRIVAEEGGKEIGIKCDNKVKAHTNPESDDSCCGGDKAKNGEKKDRPTLNTSLVSDSRLPLCQKPSRGIDREMKVHDGKDKAIDNVVKSESIFECGGLQVLTLNNFQSCSLEHTHANVGLIVRTENTGVPEQGLRSVVTTTITDNESHFDDAVKKTKNSKQLNTKEMEHLKIGQDALEMGVSNHQTGVPHKASHSFCEESDCARTRRPEICENISAFSENAFQNVSCSTNPTRDQDQEAISYVPSLQGLVLEQHETSSTLEKDDCRTEKPLKALSEHADQTSVAKVASVTSSSLQESNLSIRAGSQHADQTSVAKVASVTSFSLDECSLADPLGSQLDSGCKLEMESELPVANNVLKMLDPVMDDIKNTELAPISYSGIIPFSGAMLQSGVIPFSGSISLRSDSSNNSTRSFAFPILASEWNSSPVKMAPADRRYLRQKRRWSLGCFCCKQSATKN